jgi:hypothetical protein
MGKRFYVFTPMLIYRPPTKADDPPATIAFIFPQKNTA